jgi:hypothetical protein
MTVSGWQLEDGTPQSAGESYFSYFGGSGAGLGAAHSFHGQSTKPVVSFHHHIHR